MTFPQALETVSSREDIKSQESDQADIMSKQSESRNFKDKRKWNDWYAENINYLSTIPSELGVPLSYIIRESVDTVPEWHDNFIEKIIACAPLAVPISKADARRVHQVSNYNVQGKAVEQWIEPNKKKAKGGDWLISCLWLSVIISIICKINITINGYILSSSNQARAPTFTRRICDFTLLIRRDKTGPTIHVDAAKRGNNNVHHGSIELNSHAYTVVFGRNCAVLHYTGRECDVSPCTDTYEYIKSVRIALDGTEYISKETGQTCILVFNEGLWMGDQMENTLINQNQLQYFGLTVQENPFRSCHYSSWLKMEISHCHLMWTRSISFLKQGFQHSERFTNDLTLWWRRRIHGIHTVFGFPKPPALFRRRSRRGAAILVQSIAQEANLTTIAMRILKTAMGLYFPQ